MAAAAATMRMCLTSLHCDLKTVKTLNFTPCAVYHDRKKEKEERLM